MKLRNPCKVGYARFISNGTTAPRALLWLKPWDRPTDNLNLLGLEDLLPLGCWQKASVPHHMGLFTRWPECPHNRVPGFLHTFLEKNKAETTVVFMMELKCDHLITFS